MPHFKDFPEKDVLIMWKAFNEFLVDVPWFTDIIPGLRDSADHTRSLCSFLEYHARAARSDDIASLKRDAHLFTKDIDLPNGVNIPAFHTDMGNKSNRGWNHVGLARLLVPQSMRDKFDEDPKKFVRKVRTGVYKITAEDYPSFMHADDGYDTSAEDKALGMGEFLLLCGRRIFTGPRSAQSEPGAQGAGRKTVAQLKNMSTVTPQNIAYTAVIARFAINGQPGWRNKMASSTAPHSSNILSTYSTPILHGLAKRYSGGICNCSDTVNRTPMNITLQRAAARRSAALLHSALLAVLLNTTSNSASLPLEL
ncbi:hypothetical protein A0H81_12930 [Grifola frondosa]|uniref:Uncharacterized protein n=1 Tax=Grifola frondosa TaxID=5627 RepID=A0A1C7LRD5_GRIFR|nr:hypothetical protein A0H81_12930 [Grifola frondosa]